MLVIRDKQMSVLADHSDESFVKNLAANLRTKKYQSVDSIDNQSLENRIRIGMKKSRRYEFRTQRNMAFFITLMFRVGPEFDAHPKIENVLNMKEASADDRIALMKAFISPEIWQDAETKDADAAWARVGKESEKNGKNIQRTRAYGFSK